MKSKQEILNTLSGFYGTSQYYRVTFGMKLTDGVKYLCDACQSYWLIDAIASYQHLPKIKNDEMLQGIQFWTLTVKDGKATLICERDENDIVITQNIEFTDFPLDKIKLYYSPQDKVVLLPGEY